MRFRFRIIETFLPNFCRDYTCSYKSRKAGKYRYKPTLGIELLLTRLRVERLTNIKINFRLKMISTGFPRKNACKGEANQKSEMLGEHFIETPDY